MPKRHQRLKPWDFALARHAAEFGDPVVINALLYELIPKILYEGEQAGVGAECLCKHVLYRLLTTALYLAGCKDDNASIIFGSLLSEAQREQSSRSLKGT